MQTFIKQTAKEGKLVLITSHDMRFIERTCDRVLVIKQGQIIAQDTIQGLNAFFRKKVYKLRLQQPADTQMIVELGKVGHCRVQEEEDGLSLYYVLEKEQELYTIFDTLRRNNAGLLGLDVLQDDFEDIFLSILKNSSTKNGNAGAQA
jgi:ABC-2 type transport system ATP-binding protein